MCQRYMFGLLEHICVSAEMMEECGKRGKAFFFFSFFQGWLCFSTSSPCPWTAHPEKEHNHCRHKTSAAAVSICRQTSLPPPPHPHPPSPSTALQARLNSYPLSWQLAWRLPVWYVNLSEHRLMLQLTTIKKEKKHMSLWIQMDIMVIQVLC